MSEQMLAVLNELPRSAFDQELYFRREVGRLFRSRWCFALHADYLQGGKQACVRVGGREVILVLDPDRCVRAFPNRCLHKGERLLGPGAAQRSSMLRCPHHGWTYGLDGRLVSGPGFDVSKRATVPFLPPVAVSRLRNCIIVGPETSRAEGDLYMKIDADNHGETLVGHSTIETSLNWKLIARVLCERGWVFALANLAVLRVRGWTLLLRSEPLAPDSTELALDRCSTDASADPPGPNVVTEIVAAARVLREAQDRMIEREVAPEDRFVDDLEAAMLDAIEKGRSYLLSG